jgi:hypothetical protein
MNPFLEDVMMSKRVRSRGFLYILLVCGVAVDQFNAVYQQKNSVQEEIAERYIFNIVSHGFIRVSQQHTRDDIHTMSSILS